MQTQKHGAAMIDRNDYVAVSVDDTDSADVRAVQAMRVQHSARTVGKTAIQTGLLVFLLAAIAFSCLGGAPGAPDLGPGTQASCPHDFSVPHRAASIRCLMADGRRRAAVLERGQSSTLAKAMEEYQRRYGRAPPPAFSQWYTWNRENGGTIVDDYDQIEANLAPFRQMTVAQLQDAVLRVSDRFFPLSTVKIQGGKASMPEYPWFSSKPLMDILAPILPLLPDMTFVHNIEDFDKARGELLDGYKTSEAKGYDDVQATDAWQFYTAPCPRTFVSANSYRGRPSLDLCSSVNNTMLADNRASMTGKTHGIVNLVPLFSWAKYSTSRDLLVPHMIYAGALDRGWTSGPDTLPFASKNASLYWRGSTTGKSMLPELWRSNHRVRFVHYFNSFQAAVERLEKADGNFEAAKVYPLLHQLEDTADNRRLFRALPASTFQVGFSHAAQCDGDVKGGPTSGCDDLFHEIPLMARLPMGEERNHQFVVDMDGNSMSGRYYRMLESNSVVLKETLFAEWHDDRLVPWYHFIPVEPHAHHHVPAILDYMINTAEGRRAAEEIASNGRRAAETTLRVNDLRAYWLRLLLEYHALFT